jgi:hypothetical protein
VRYLRFSQCADEDLSLLGCDAMLNVKMLPTPTQNLNNEAALLISSFNN